MATRWVWLLLDGRGYRFVDVSSVPNVNLFVLQNLPALVLKIMQASAAIDPIDPDYSEGLKALIYSLLQRHPDDRPSVHKVMAAPVLVNIHMNLATDVGRLSCTK